GQSTADRAACYAGCRRCRSDPTITCGLRFARCYETAYPLINKRSHCGEPLSNACNISHPIKIRQLQLAPHHSSQILSLRRWIPSDSFLAIRLFCPGCLVWIDDGAQHDPALFRPVVARAAVHRRALVPHQHVADPPAMIVNETVLRGVLGEFLDQRPG